MASNSSALSSNAQRLFNDAEKLHDGKISPQYKWDEKKYTFNVRAAIEELAKKEKIASGWARTLPPQKSGLGHAIRCVGEMCGFNMGPKYISYHNMRKRTRKGSRKNSRKGSRKNNRK
jgi:hypothetical protein